MRQVAFDDALVGLASAVMLQAVEDFQKLQRHGVITAEGEVVFHRLGDRIGRSSSYKHIDGFRHSSEAAELCEFLKGWGLELLCDLTGYHACRIRRKLGLSHIQGRKAK
jgi:hypothetical protein